MGFLNVVIHIYLVWCNPHYAVFCPFPLIFSLSLSSEIDAFIFHPHGLPSNAGKELDPLLGLSISKSTFVVMPFIVVLMFLHTPIGSISP